jgi:uncharacterized coiled-coil DUF342 family protein
VSSDSLLALGTLIAAGAAAFGTIAASLRTGRKEREDSAMKAYAQVVDERQEWAKEMREDNVRLRRENKELQEEVQRLRAGRGVR